ncbi:hypothetical protein LWI28_024045 [Acer negundo]|uniref:Uncharacterized protein n=1 Tax=Acer negundo TaxID=4023 RepID=A0AAD5IBJ2_ACENE|nr:hypothetical protein LWI28_024045 [Acer negundo]
MRYRGSRPDFGGVETKRALRCIGAKGNDYVDRNRREGLVFATWRHSIELYSLNNVDGFSRIPTHLLRSLMWGKAILYEGMRWRVGNGKKSRVYGDKWIPRDNVPFIISPRNLDVNSTVDRLLSPAGNWDIQKLQQNFVQFDVDGILQIPTGIGELEDRRVAV